MSKTTPVPNHQPTTHMAAVWGGFAFGSIPCFVALVKLPKSPSLFLHSIFGDFGVLAFVAFLCVSFGIAGAFWANHQLEKQKHFPLISIIGFALCGLLFLFPNLSQ